MKDHWLCLFGVAWSSWKKLSLLHGGKRRDNLAVVLYCCHRRGCFLMTHALQSKHLRTSLKNCFVSWTCIVHGIRTMWYLIKFTESSEGLRAQMEKKGKSLTQANVRRQRWTNTAAFRADSVSFPWMRYPSRGLYKSVICKSISVGPWVCFLSAGELCRPLLRCAPIDIVIVLKANTEEFVTGGETSAK